MKKNVFNTTDTKKSKSTLISFVIRIWTLHALAFVAYIILLTALVPIIGDTAGAVITSILSTVIFVIFTYLEGWKTAFRDANLIHTGRISANKFKSVEAAFLSQLPGIALAVMMLLPSPPVFVNNFIRYFYMFAAYAINALAQSSAFAYFIPVAVPFITVILGYELGLRDIRLVNILVYRRPGSQDELR